MRLVLLALVLAGCAADTPSDAPSAPETSGPLALADVPTFDLGGVSSSSRPVDPADIRAQMVERGRTAGAYFDAMASLESEVARRRGWRSLEAVADSLSPAVPDLWQDVFEGSVTSRMVRALISTPDLDADGLDALGGYTLSWSSSGTAEGDDLLRALIRLGGHWDGEQRARVAQIAARNLAAAFVRRADCVGCTVEEALDGMWPATRDSNDPLLYDMQTVHRELVRIGRNGTPMP